MIPPVLAEDVSLARWAQTITMEKDGNVEAIIQAELINDGSSYIQGMSFLVPASQITMVYDFDHTFSSSGMVVREQAIREGTRLVIDFNASVAPGSSWNGRLGFFCRGWAAKGENYSIVIPLNPPEILTPSGRITPELLQDIDLRVQVFLPESVEATSITPKPFKILFQNLQRVPTWNPASIKMGETARIEASYSETLNKIVSSEKKRREVLDQVRGAKASARNVSEAERHLAKAENYILHQALGKFNIQEYTIAEEYLAYAGQEISQAENALEGQTPKGIPITPQKTPMLCMAVPIAVLYIAFLIISKSKTKN